MSKDACFASIFPALAALLCAVAPASAQCTSGSNCQIVLSGTGLPATCGQAKVSGFWIWSQPSSAGNAYGADGQGNLYFYGVAQAPVSASNIVLSGNTVSETVSGVSASGVTMSCTLTAHQTSPGFGILDSATCTVNGASCSIATPAAITVVISNVN
jgi:hypothetical protein